ncbi:hypothetical protein BZA05DRAFT_192690 [Tricharina praecox]|uniref:uncharacterized protein n=1 Tax=Tricharina praecox TaxID=43433 RepID=UPI00221F22D9|nr:uncharacterized protein BZA05DRAFT_192690 [Tricharina praecox]KAI5842361.1 hypothetical protein BZA05DRAFT_192690 [Tricharina praecox]
MADTDTADTATADPVAVANAAITQNTRMVTHTTTTDTVITANAAIAQDMATPKRTAMSKDTPPVTNATQDTAMSNDTAPVVDATHVQNGNEDEPTSTAGGGDAPSLWSRAFNSGELSAHECRALSGIRIDTDTRQIAAALGTMTNGIMEERKGKDRKIRFKGDDIVLRDIAMKIGRWIQRFKDIGDIVVQYDPGHAALPWAGFRFLLQLCLDKQETVDAILVGLEKSVCITDWCAIYEHLYLNKTTEASQNLEKSILRLYTAILKFLAKSIVRLKGA